MVSIFFCYANKDRPHLDEFLTHLKPFSPRLDLWSDRDRVEAGDDWHEKIQMALRNSDIAVVLVSANALASEYIGTHELPYLVERWCADEGSLTLLFAGPCAADRNDIGLQDDRGQPFRLTRITGLNLPTAFAFENDGAPRHDILARAAQDLVDRARSRQRPSRTSVPRQRAELYVKLTRDDDRLERRVHLDRDTRLEVGGILPLPPILLRWTKGDLSLVNSREFTDAMFAAIFGSDATEIASLDTAIRKPVTIDGRPHSRRVARVRLEVDDALLESLPWSRTTRGGRRLFDEGWTFELTPPGFSRTSRRLTAAWPAPATVLVALPSNGRADDHDLAERLKNLADHRGRKVLREPLIAHSIEEIRKQVSHGLPDAIIVFARTSGSLIDFPRSASDPSRAGLEELAAAIGDATPEIVVVSLVGSSFPRHAGLGARACRWPCVLLAFHPDERVQLDRTHDLARHLLCPQSDDDPVAIGHASECETVRAIATYESWSIASAPSSVDSKTAHLLLDRTDQRKDVGWEVDKSIKDSRRKVVTLVIHGDDAGLPAKFPAQLHAYLDRYRSGDLAIATREIDVSKARARASSREPHAIVRQALMADAAAPIGSVLHNARPKANSQQTPFLVLGIHLDSKDWDRECLNAELESWAAFGLDVSQAPGLANLRILLLLVCETRHDIDRARMRKLVAAPSHQVEVLPRLGSVTDEHIVEFLTTPGFSSCPNAEIAEQLSKLLAPTPEGTKYDEVASQIEWAENNSYFNLVKRLRNRTKDKEDPSTEHPA